MFYVYIPRNLNCLDRMKVIDGLANSDMLLTSTAQI